jgi:hypothetical protein
VTVEAKPIIVIEGLYALHRRLRHHYGLRLWVDTCARTRMARVEARDGKARIGLWHSVYLPREATYLRQQKPFDDADAFILGAALEWADTRRCFARTVASVPGALAAAERVSGPR